MALADDLLRQGIANHEAGRLDEAETLYRRALSKAPHHPWAHNLMGSLLQDRGRIEEALAAFDRAFKCEPGYIEAAFNSANALLRLGRNEEAAARFERAIALRPDYAKAFCGLGQARQRLRQAEAAEAAYRRALASRPDFAEARANLASLQRETGRLDEAEASFAAALQLDPRLPEALNGLGELLQARGRLERGEDFLRQALAIQPDYPDALNTLGVLLLEQGRLREAEDCLKRAVDLSPETAMLLSNLGTVYMAQGDTGRADDAYRRAMAIEPSPVTHSNVIFLMDFDERATTESQQAERKQWNARYAAALTATWHPHRNDRDPERRVRVGYVSADFRMHSAAFAFVPMLCHYDRHGFEVHCYSNSARVDQMTEKFRRSVDGWRNIQGLSDEDVAAMVRADGIDILVDLSGHSAGNRLLTFARKPAPVQVTGWGLPNGTGMAAMDYLVSDPVSIPAGERGHYVEAFADLPCQISYQCPTDAPPAAASPMLASGAVTFGCFNKLVKLKTDSFVLWAELLKRLPGSRLLLKAAELNDPGQQARLKGVFADLGVEPARVTLRGRTTWFEHLQQFADVDISLDPVSYSGGISTFESLWMGVPVVALNGATMTRRSSAAILSSLGMADWVARSAEEYVDLALRKSAETSTLTQLRQSLRETMASSAVCNPARYQSLLEQHYREMWRKWASHE